MARRPSSKYCGARELHDVRHLRMQRRRPSLLILGPGFQQIISKPLNVLARRRKLSLRVQPLSRKCFGSLEQQRRRALDRYHTRLQLEHGIILGKICAVPRRLADGARPTQPHWREHTARARSYCPARAVQTLKQMAATHAHHTNPRKQHTHAHALEPQ